MIRSMTGYGRREAARGPVRLTVEMRAVNHRFCEIIVRLPKTWGMLEDRVKKVIAGYVQRGRVDVSVTIDTESSQHAGLSIDWELARNYVDTAKLMSKEFVLQDSLSAKDLLSMPGVMQSEQKVTLSAEEVEEWLVSLVKEASEELYSMKEAEGKTLLQDLSQRLSQVMAWSKEISGQAPHAVTEYRRRLQQRVTELSGEISFEFDQQRLAQEIALFADRSDISEETTRLESHCNQFAEQLPKAEPVGRKLDFLLQEMNREANTIAAKANFLPIQRLAVEMKTELEKMREQVQNIE